MNDTASIAARSSGECPAEDRPAEDRPVEEHPAEECPANASGANAPGANASVAGAGASAPEWRVAAGLTPYPDALAAMQQRVAAIRAGTAEELVWLVEHPPLYTAGTSARPEELTDPARFPTFSAGRGGQWTYHGPGQRTAYVMLDLTRRHGSVPARDIGCYVHGLEAWLIAALARFGVRGERRTGRIGIWVADPDTDAFEGILGGGYVRDTHRAGGIEGGMSTGSPIVARVSMKPLATLNRPTLETVDVVTKESTVSFKERTDVTAVPAMGVVAETMTALVLASEALRKFGGDSVEEFRRNRLGYLESLGDTPSSAGAALSDA